MKRILVALAVTGVLAGWFASAGGGATTLPLTNYGDMVVDADHNHVFVTGGFGNDSVVVLDLEGGIVRVIESQEGAAGMVLDSASSTLYVALSGSTEISRISSETLTELGRFSVAPGPPPFTLAFAGGRLWVSGCGNTPGLASITPTGTDLKTYDGGCTVFASSPTDPSLLAVGGPGGSPAIVTILDVSADPPEEQVSGAPPGDVYGASNLQDMVVTPDGLGLLVACGYPYFHQSISINDLTRLVKYQTDAYPSSVAVSPDGDFVAGGIGSTVFLFESGNGTAFRSHALDPPRSVLTGGLAFSPNGRTVYAVAEGPQSHDIKLYLLSNREPTMISLNASRRRVIYGQGSTLTAHLSVGDERVSIYATPQGGKKTLVKRAQVNSSGDLQVTVHPKKKTAYTATYAGDDTHEAAVSGGETILVQVITTATVGGFYGASGQYKLFHLGDAIRQTGKVVPNHAGQRLKFVAQLHSNGGWHTLATGSFRIGRNGTATAFLTPGGTASLRLRNEFAGDRDHLGDVSPWRYVRVTG